MDQNRAVKEAFAAFERGDLARAQMLVDERFAAKDDSPLLQHLAGLVAFSSGNHESGVEWLRRASDGEPHNARFRVVLAQALIDSGRPGDALDVLPSPAILDPADLSLVAVRAEAAFKANRRDLESDCWSAFCAVRPNEPLALINLARSLLAQSRFREAEQAYRRSLALLPAHTPAIHELALTLERTNQIGPLEQLMKEASERGIGQDVLAEPWALLELRRGRPERAIAHLRVAPAGSDPVRWNRLKVRAFDALGNASAAFAAAREMNGVVPNGQNARVAAERFRREVRDLARIITDDWAAKIPVLAPVPAPRIAFLVGFPRSGTTLADTFLMGHVHCRVIEELPLLNAAAAELGPLTGLGDVHASLLERVRENYLRQVQSVVAWAPPQVIVDKFPLNMLSAPLIHALFPGAPVLFVQRHPCDAVLSGFMQSFEPSAGMGSFLDLNDAAMFYDCVMAAWWSIRSALPLNVHTIVYEELVQNPEEALRPALSALGLDWDEHVLDHRSTAGRRATLLNTSYNQVTEQLTSSAAGRWRRYKDQLRDVLPLLMPWARRLGYED